MYDLSILMIPAIQNVLRNDRHHAEQGKKRKVHRCPRTLDQLYRISQKQNRIYYRMSHCSHIIDMVFFRKNIVHCLFPPKYAKNPNKFYHIYLLITSKS